MCSEESHSSFCSPFSSAKFLVFTANLSSFTATGPDKVAYCMLSTFLALAWIFFFTFSIFSGLYISFLSSGRCLPLFPSIRWESLSTLLLPPGLTLSRAACQTFLNASFYPINSSFWSLISFSLSRQAGFCPGRSTLDQILFLSHSISNGFNKSRPGFRTILSTTDFLKASTLSDIPLFPTNLFRLGSLLALLVGLNLSFLTSVLLWFFKITKVAPFDSVEVFCKDPSMALYFFSFSLVFHPDGFLILALPT